MFRRRSPLLLTLVATLLLPPAVSAADPPVAVSADLDGKAIALVSVSAYHCHDFDYPRIHCFSTPGGLEAAVATSPGTVGLLGTTAVNYVLIFENIWYGGAHMYVSQDYGALALLGWNDRISSFKAQNSETGSFHWDWLYGGGTPYTFCCNQNVSSLGTWNDNISSVRRT
jgi:hypothetical protein